MTNDGRDGDIDARFDDIMSHWDDSYAEPATRTDGDIESGPATAGAVGTDGTTDAGEQGADGADGAGEQGADGAGGAGDPGSGVGKSINPAPRYRIIRLPETDDQTASDRTGATTPGAVGDGAAGDGAPVAGEGVDRASGPGTPPADGAGFTDSGWRSHPEVEDDDHFVPPPPAPLPAGDLQFWGILVGLIGGPGLLLYLIMFDRYASSLWTALAIALGLGGFGLLIARLPNRRDEDDGDDGARV